LDRGRAAAGGPAPRGRARRPRVGGPSCRRGLGRHRRHPAAARRPARCRIRRGRESPAPPRARRSRPRRALSETARRSGKSWEEVESDRSTSKGLFALAKMIDRATGLGPDVTPEYRELVERWERKAERTPPRSGRGSGAVDRTISDVPLKTVYGPADV